MENSETRRLKLALIDIALLVVSGVTAFAILALLHNPDTKASDVSTGDPPAGPPTLTVSTVEEAESITGYPIASPASLPAGFVRSENILVNKLSSTYFVQQFWMSSADPSIQFDLEQHPGLDGLGNSEPAIINGVPGERKLLPASPPGRPHPRLSLFWKDGETSYALSGTLAGTLTEATLLEIAASVSLPEDNPSSKVR